MNQIPDKEGQKKLLAMPLAKRIYLATNEVMRDLGPAVDVIINMRLSHERIADKYGLRHDFVNDWAIKQLPLTSALNAYNDEDDDDEDYDGESEPAGE